MYHLTDEEKKMPRRVRRAIMSNRRGVVKKKTVFGRVKVVDFQVGDPTAETSRDNRTVYRHFTKGVVDRRTTDPLLWSLVG